MAYITMDSPKNLNAFDEVMIEQLVDALKQAQVNTQVRVVILRSRGKNFSGGGDIVAMYDGIQHETLNFDQAIAMMANVSLTIRRLGKPVIAAVSGAVAGAGFNVVLACDFCVAADDSRFIQAFVGIGLVPDAGGFYLLTRAVGVNKAAELAMTGRTVDAAEARQLGFVCEVCGAERLQETVQALALRLAAGPAHAFAKMKELVWESSFRDFERYIQAEVQAQTECGSNPEFREGVCAFMEKRRPSFTK